MTAGAKSARGNQKESEEEKRSSRNAELCGELQIIIVCVFHGVGKFMGLHRRECEGKASQPGAGPWMFANQIECVAPQCQTAFASVCERVVVRKLLEVFDNRLDAHPRRRADTSGNHKQDERNRQRAAILS